MNSIASNVASTKAAKAEKSVNDQLHAQDYLVYAFLQLGQDQNARAVVDDMLKTPIDNSFAFPAYYARAASTARYMVERGDWKVPRTLRSSLADFSCHGDYIFFACARRRAKWKSGSS